MIAAIVLGLIALVAAWRIWRRAPRYRWVLIVGQFVSAGLLYAFVFASTGPAESSDLIVLTEGATAEQLAKLQGDDVVVVLPEFVSPAMAGAPRDVLRIGEHEAYRVPDLATALREAPGAKSVRIVGRGLGARDRDAAGASALHFDEAPGLPGIIELYAPPGVLAGSPWRVRGRVTATVPARIELRDPADSVVATSALNDDGRFDLQAVAKSAGKMLFELRVLDEQDKILEQFPLALDVRPGQAIKALLLAGGPQPEQKYLRRWALDAGVDLRAEVVLTDRASLRQGDSTLDARSLGQLDLLIVDERVWSSLAANEKAAITEAVRKGLGLLLRITGPLPARVASDWAALGFKITGADIAQTITLTDEQDAIALARRPITVEARNAIDLLNAADHSALARWLALGQGRVAAWWLDDSFKLALQGHAEQFGGLWSHVFQTLARARAASSLRVPDLARVNERAIFCGQSRDARIVAPITDAQSLTVEPGQVERGCAAFWPAVAGWHTLEADGVARSFFIFDQHQGRALFAVRDQQATRRLATSENLEAPSVTPASSPLRSMIFIAWLIVSAASWWLERKTRSL